MQASGGKGGGVVLAASASDRGGAMDDEVDVSDVVGAGFEEVAGAVAKIGELQVGVAGELKSGSDEDGIDFHAGGARKLEVKLGGLVSLGGARKDPSATGEQGSGEKADHPLRLVGAQGGEVEDSVPATKRRMECVGHSGFFGCRERGV